MAAKADGQHVVRLGELPGEVEGQPVVGLLDLVAVLNLLAKDAVLVADAVADGGDVEGGQRIEEAGRQPPQAAIAQPRLYVAGHDFFEWVLRVAEGIAGDLGPVRVEQVLWQLPAKQVFGRKVID